MIEFVQALAKPIEQMTLKELRREKAAHKWQANKLTRGVYLLGRRLMWLEENYHLVDLEDAKAKYQRGEINNSQYKALCGKQGRRIQEYRQAADCHEYGNRLLTNERAIIKYIDERIEDVSSRPQSRGRRRGKIDPRKPASYYNQKDAWKDAHPCARPPKKLRKHNEKWETIKQQNRISNRVLKMSQAIDTWDYNKLKAIAQDRGYYTDMAIYAAVSDEMDMSVNGAKKLLETGRMSWGQILMIGALFEMTPLEFCDVFLSGYFKEAVNGKWVATIEDKDALMAQIIATRPSYDNFHPNKDKPISVSEEDDESED